MEARPRTLQHLIVLAKAFRPLRVAVADAAQPIVIAALKEAHDSGLAEPILIGDATAIDDACREIGWAPRREWIVPAATEAAAASRAAELVKIGAADAAREKGIVSEVAGDADILLVPDLVSGNMIAKEHACGPLPG